LREVFPLMTAAVPPSGAAVLKGQGIPPDAVVPERVSQLVEQARELYAALADPRGLYAEIGRAEFAELYGGEGRNEQSTPLASIYPRASRLALFAATMGGAVSRKISELFAHNDPALAFMLDAIASERAELAAELVGRHYLDGLVNAGSAISPTVVLAYSPGYCGWHVTGQRRLFGYLQPDEIGITLNASCLMQPLKSVSGLIGLSPPEEIEEYASPCERCELRHCNMRR
jgi:hypothetical protein